MNYYDIRFLDISNGPSLRTSLFVSGCSHYCKNCWNHKLWNPSAGQVFTHEQINEILVSIEHPRTRGLSILGGEPLTSYNVDGIYTLLKLFRERFGDTKDVWIWSGWTFEEIMRDEFKRKVIKLCDVLVDGRFEESLKDLNLAFRGSSNQRIIDVSKSIDKNEVICYNYI